MEEKGLTDEEIDTFYPMFFGVSCAFFALRLLPENEIGDDKKWSEIRNRMLKGSAHLLGLFIWRLKIAKKTDLGQNLENAHKQIEDLKKRRSEEAKANEKVVSIFAAREQSWFLDRKNLRHQIAVLTKKEESIFELTEKLKEKEALLQEKDKSITEIEEKLNELRETVKNEAQRHFNETLKHKTTFIELVSNQRQLEADMGRALRQVEASRQDLDSVLDQKEQSVLMAQRLSMELVKTRKDSEQKDQILSAMLRKSRLDTDERQMLLNEVKASKTKHERHSLRSMLSYKHVNEPQLIDDVAELENWMKSEAKTYKIAIQQKHDLEIEAFAEQMRLKDEKIEAYRWRLLSMELESKRLQSHIEGLDCDVSHLRQENMKLEAELHSTKEQLVLQFNPPNLQKLNFNPSLDTNHDTVWSKVKVVKRKPGQKNQETDAVIDEEISQSENNEKDIVLTLAYPQKQMHYSDESSKKNNSVMKIDIHALGVSYKIKRLKQQFLMLERLTGKKQETSENIENTSVNGIYELISILNKQVDRYQSLQAKTDDICQRMQEKDLNLNCGSSGIARTEEETKRLEQYLDETFQLQRYIVATGQKLVEVQAKIVFGFVAYAENIEKPDNFDMKRFSDSIGTLFREVQRGFEVRISRIIGDLEGTLAFDGIINFKKIVWNS